MSEDQELTGYAKERADKQALIEEAAAIQPEGSVFEVPEPWQPPELDGEPEWAPPAVNVPVTDNDPPEDEDDYS